MVNAPMTKTQDLYDKAKRLIPTGTQLWSKRPELYSANWPAYYSKARGIEVTDLDGNTYLDFSTMGLGACVLGYGDEGVDTAVLRTVARGSASSLNCPEEVELADVLLTLHPWAQQVRYARSGGEAMAIAIRIAQAATGNTNVEHREKSYHGWHVNSPLPPWERYTEYHEYDDWNNGAGSDDLAAIIVEPFRLTEPKEGYLEKIRRRATRLKAALIFDEISSGFRRTLGGVHLHYGVTPDIAVFGKAMSNGYPMAAVIGTEDVMSAAKDTFISSTSWSERIGPTAALATIQKMWANDVQDHIRDIGSAVRDVWADCARQTGLEITITGHPSMLHIEFESIEVQTLYTQLMLRKGFLASRDFYPSYAHTIEDVELFLPAIRDTFQTIQTAKEHDVVRDLLVGPVAETGIQRRT